MAIGFSADFWFNHDFDRASTPQGPYGLDHHHCSVVEVWSDTACYPPPPLHANGEARCPPTLVFPSASPRGPHLPPPLPSLPFGPILLVGPGWICKRSQTNTPQFSMRTPSCTGNGCPVYGGEFMAVLTCEAATVTTCRSSLGPTCLTQQSPAVAVTVSFNIDVQPSEGADCAVPRPAVPPPPCHQ